jgi:hypothetical protein
MKTMMKKCGVYAALTAVLLVMAALVTGCPVSAPESSGHKPPAGMGSVRLIFDENIARATILPENATINSFAEFVLDFTAVGGTGAVTQSGITRTLAARNTPVNLVPGSYDVQVVARLTAGVATSAAAVWTSGAGTPISVVASNPQTLNVTLKPYDPADATLPGTFAWDIDSSQLTDPIEIGSEMKLTTLAGAAAGGSWSDIDLTIPANLTNTTGVSVLSNYYYVDITLVVNGVTRNFRHIVHIYQNMKSTFSYAFTNNHINVVVTITPDIIYVHPSDNPPVVQLTTTSGKTIVGNGAADSPYILSLTGNTRPNNLTINVTNVAAFSGGVSYYLNATQLGTGSPFAIPTTTPFDAAGGPYQISVVGLSGAASPTPYSTEIYIVVDADLP